MQVDWCRPVSKGNINCLEVSVALAVKSTVLVMAWKALFYLAVLTSDLISLFSSHTSRFPTHARTIPALAGISFGWHTPHIFALLFFSDIQGSAKMCSERMLKM